MYSSLTNYAHRHLFRVERSIERRKPTKLQEELNQITKRSLFFVVGEKFDLFLIEIDFYVKEGEREKNKKC